MALDAPADALAADFLEKGSSPENLGGALVVVDSLGGGDESISYQDTVHREALLREVSVPSLGTVPCFR